MQERWEQKAAGLRYSKVYFTGFVEIEELPSYYAASDIYIHPSAIDAHPISVSAAFIGMPCNYQR